LKAVNHSMQEDGRVSVTAKQDHSISERLEGRRYPAFEGLAYLLDPMA
jgi:hypothetical protein